jgi:ATP-dependent Lon protease
MITYINNVKNRLDQVIYGHKESKNQALRLISSVIANNTSKGGNVFAISGPPGVGKTQIAGEIARSLGRPYVKINLGGANNGDDLTGHGYTYEGSTPGRIATSLVTAGCMNPVLLFDELDKVSNTPKGNEINNILIHLTDDTQNSTFTDKYLTGVNLDLSKALMIFTFNDGSNISPILLDRMKIIKVDGYKIDDKIVIAQKHLIPNIEKDLGFPSSQKYCFEENVLRDLINQYTFEGGVRRLKQIITDILMELNLRRMSGVKVDGQMCEDIVTITKKMIKNDIFKDKHYIQHTMVSDLNQSGLVNGLWANSYGVGGIIPIQAHLIPTNNKFELQLTGMQGDVMKESMLVAKTVAWELLPDERKREIRKDWKLNGSSGVHIHCPDGSTPKDGPSAGAAITTCMFSLLTNAKVNQKVAMTGEINLKGSITEIGGLEEKIFGAITAGANTVLYPVDNQRDVDKIISKYPSLSTEHNMTLIPVSRIEEVLRHVIID